jgi:hypothetical protein
MFALVSRASRSLAMLFSVGALTTIITISLVEPSHAADWRPAKGPLATRWSRDVKPDDVHAEYPRPQLVRPRWTNLNGLWQYALTPKADGKPEKFEGEILVPFPIESALSGVMKPVDPKTRLWYRRGFKTPESHPGEHVLLHFGAVDWETTVWVNGKEVGQHRGGYDPFTLDITAAIAPHAAEQELVVAVWDPTDTGPQPHGKQVLHPGGIMYTPTTGIWQTVWTEVVPPTYIAGLKLTPNIERGEVQVEVQFGGAPPAGLLSAKALDGEKEVARTEAPANSPTLTLKIPQPRLWTPDDPHLYRLQIALPASGDAVESYAGLRKISLEKDAAGIPRLMLNSQFVFQTGPLDQGFWPDGLYTAPTDEALRYDLEITKRLGFNMVRKHVKVEPERWYYWCDRLGLLVWQDMPSGDRAIGPNDPDIKKDPAAAEQFERELRAMIDTHYNHPSIVLWVAFNEGWGQYDTARITNWIKQHDPSRLVNCASGWADRPTGDVIDMHNYPGPGSPHPAGDRAAVLGEFGGLGLPVPAHVWQADKNWGYQSFTDRDKLTANLVDRFARIPGLIASPGLCASVYTQTTDVEVEVNGLLTYDRTIIKCDVEKLAQANRRLHEPPPVVKTLVPTSEKQPYEWRYTTEKPADDWTKVDFDDSGWKSGPGGFGEATTPGAVVRTEWKTADIWLRRVIELPTAASEEVALRMHHDEDADVYFNGERAGEASGYSTSYESSPVQPKAQAALHAGKNTLAVHCHQTGGGQYIDVGIDTVQRPNSAKGPATAAGEWRSLFDGQTLKGWQPTPFAGHNDADVEDEKIVIRFGEPMTGVSFVGEVPHDNYELELDAQRVDGSDFFCGLTFPVADEPCSLILGGWGGGLVGLSSINGHDASENETTKVADFKNGQWYHVRLKVTKPKIEAWIDKDQLIDVERADKKFSIRREMELSKPLGVATYMTTGALKNIRIRQLP